MMEDINQIIDNAYNLGHTLTNDEKSALRKLAKKIGPLKDDFYNAGHDLTPEEKIELASKARKALDKKL